MRNRFRVIGITTVVLVASLTSASPMVSSEESVQRITEVIERPARSNEIKLRDYQQALTMLDRFSRDYADPVNQATASLLRGSALLGLGQMDEARVSLDAALSGPLPGDRVVVANYLHGRVLLEQGQHAAGIDALHRAVRANPSHPIIPNVRFILAYAHMENSDVIAARGQIDTLMAIGGPQWVMEGAATLRENLQWIGQAAPAFRTRTLDGRQMSLADLRGHVVLIDFWASWCPPCIAMLPDVQNVYAKYRRQGFEIVGISLDHTRGDLTRFLGSNNMPWIHVYENKEELADRYKVVEIPKTFLLDREGNIAAVDLHGERLDATIARLLDAR